MTPSDPYDFRCRSCRRGDHRCDPWRGCECVLTGVDRTVDPPRLILCPGLERDVREDA